MKITKDMQFTIKEVEEIMKIPRSTIRHYMNKGLISVNRDEANGYYYYTVSDLVRLAQVLYDRNTMGFTVENIENLFNASTRREIINIFEKQKEHVQGNIEKENTKLKALNSNLEIMERIFVYENIITLIPVEPLHIFSNKHLFDSTSRIFSTNYNVGQFDFDGTNLTYERLCSFVFEKDLSFLTAEDLKERERIIKRSICVYSVIPTESFVDDAELLWPLINWATKHRFRLLAPFFLTHRFDYRKDGKKVNFLEAFLPVDVL